ncbi:hypothetical protein Clacol_006277 [Clathrus columnatus]|uniref:DUF6533 domain-containing protein n=1 Tax=Clathrus columnatus TaxID=1419009 RepID=A0AAV5AHS5_9AGAM|nr:hypothetical protein Clacol_006277 [Clathrus columnatus]
MSQNLTAEAISFATAYRDIVATRCLTYAGFTVLMYDYVLTFSMEVIHIWSHPKNMVSVIFLFCKNWFIIEGMLVVFSFSMIHALVAMRVSALHGQARWVVVLLVLAWFGYVISTYALVGIGTTPLASTNVPTQPYNICSTTVPPGLWVVWLPSLFFETLIVILTVVRVIRNIGCDISKSTPVAYLMYRDGILYFLVMASNSLLCLLDWLVAPPALSALAKYFSHAICVTASSRLVLNLRSLGPMDILFTTFDFHDQFEYDYSRSVGETSIPEFGAFGFTATRRNSRPMDSFFDMEGLDRVLSGEKGDGVIALSDLGEADSGRNLSDFTQTDISSLPLNPK